MESKDIIGWLQSCNEELVPVDEQREQFLSGAIYSYEDAKSIVEMTRDFEYYKNNSCVEWVVSNFENSLG